MVQKAVIYARVSSDAQEREGFSIPAQKELLEKYAKDNGYSVVKVFEEAQTAKQSGRVQYNEMLAYLKRHTDVNIILVEKTDRLFRNLYDYGRLEEEREIDVTIHFVKENEIIGKNATSHQKFIHGLKILMARNYIDNLKEETRKGMHKKAQEGYFTNRAPYGYKNTICETTRKKIVVINKKTAPYVKRAFEIYSSGDISLKSTAQKLYDEGYIYSASLSKLSVGGLENILKNVFYIGQFYHRGELMTENVKHEPLITMKLWRDVQKAFKKDNKPKFGRHQFPLSNFLFCGECGRAIVGEIKKGKYIYYHCSWGGNKTSCTQHSYFNEDKLMKQLDEAIKAVKITDNEIGAILSAIHELNVREQAEVDGNIKRYREQEEKLTKQIRALLEEKLEGNITHDEWREIKNEKQNQLDTIRRLIEANNTADSNYMDYVVEILELFKNFQDVYFKSSAAEKVNLAKTLLSNCTLKDGKLSYDYKEPFSYIVEMGKNKKIYPGLDSNQ